MANTNSRVKSTPKTMQVEEVDNTEKVVKVEKKKFSATDMIPCLSITPGKLFFEGAKTKTLYSWADADAIEEIEYQDLAYAARAKDRIVYKPRFIVQDKDFLKEFPRLEETYAGLYSVEDLESILKLTPSQIERAVMSLPEGAKDALKTIVATKIANGTFDSVKRIQKLDEIFDTKMLMRLVEE